MPSYPALRDRLPSLYRPEPGAGDLLARLLKAVARLLDRTDAEVARILHAHWRDMADAGQYSPFLRAVNALAGKDPPAAGDGAVRLFPYVDDLARIGALLGILPWRDPPAQREPVEAYRQRLARMVSLYRNGLGTVAALRAMAEAQLPVDLTLPAGLRDRPFTVEEFPALASAPAAIAARGAPTDMVGPLMQWALDNPGLEPAALTCYIQGVKPVAGQVDATARPLVELHAAGGQPVRLGIAYDGTLAAGETLRLRPAYRSWLLGPAGIAEARADPGGSEAADPSAPGPWQPLSGAPAGAASAIHQSRDGFLWVAVAAGSGSALWRHDGQNWTRVLDALPAVACLAGDGDELLIGSAAGLLRVSLYPAGGGDATTTPDPASLAGPAIHALLHDAAGQWWVGSDEGLARLESGDALGGTVLTGATATPVRALHQDAAGNLLVGTDRGLFQRLAGVGRWYRYQGREHAEQLGEWRAFDPADGLPAEDDVFLPAVHAIHRSRDGRLWLGTAAGIACYLAHAAGPLTYTTLLAAYPDLGSAPVHAIARDARGCLWFATAQGLLRYDGRDWWQLRAKALVRLPAGDAVAPWRYVRASARWERFTGDAAGTWQPFAGERRAPAQAAVSAIHWHDAVQAELGQLDGGHFTPAPGAVLAPLRMRYKVDGDTRCLDAGVPAIPRLPKGSSVWRYLSLEAGETPPAGRPAWTREGRLLPPPPHEAVAEGRYGAFPAPLDLSRFEAAAFAYPPAARVWLARETSQPATVLVRLARLSADETLDPALLDRVWRGIEQVRPAGVQALLAVDQTIVRGA